MGHLALLRRTYCTFSQHDKSTLLVFRVKRKQKNVNLNARAQSEGSEMLMQIHSFISSAISNSISLCFTPVVMLMDFHVMFLTVTSLLPDVLMLAHFELI